MASLQALSASSPHKAGVGALTNHAQPLGSLTTNVTSNRHALKDELTGHIVFDDHSVFRRLGIEELPAGLVDACIAALENDPAVQNARQELEKVVTDAKKMTAKELAEERNIEKEGLGGTVAGQKVRKPSRREQSMYKPMVSTIIYPFLF